MFHTSFDDLEASLEASLQSMKKKKLLQEASKASSKEKFQTDLRHQLEDQAALLTRIKNHHREVRTDPSWNSLEAQAKKLLNIRTLFNAEQQEEYNRFKTAVNRLITTKLNEIDISLNERILDNAFAKADRSKQVKIYKNWTSV